MFHKCFPLPPPFLHVRLLFLLQGACFFFCCFFISFSYYAVFAICYLSTYATYTLSNLIAAQLRAVWLVQVGIQRWEKTASPADPAAVLSETAPALPTSKCSRTLTPGEGKRTALRLWILRATNSHPSERAQAPMLETEIPSASKFVRKLVLLLCEGPELCLGFFES